MKIDLAIEKVKAHLTEERFQHSIRVAETAVKLAELYRDSTEKAELAAIFHDYAKYRPLDEMKHWIKKSPLPKDLLHYHHELWHGPVGALLIEAEHGIVDKEIQNAIHYHTTGRAHMSKLDKIIFLADYIEPGRKFPGVDDVREMAKKDLTKACWMASRNTINHLVNKGNTIYPDTFYAYNDLTNQINGGA
ncbi:bis(5'-nucleosyl)-tetraphosphatase (symmetrical) YqeK [Oceanobacillus saliphilus]|uniref:bis(5'-nucleosyl)-tetraphosphatase (symmetrical) YqeK n=1 Tax=Oceanobacillus saliphilus TaxID=2925834 RepID=UPI00201E025A|nr:bis(5'-nucleosyl)-tetraphosphatase (symmetrical) YqeK [Oceanobacillus saliphilus]